MGADERVEEGTRALGTVASGEGRGQRKGVKGRERVFVLGVDDLSKGEARTLATEGSTTGSAAAGRPVRHVRRAHRWIRVSF